MPNGASPVRVVPIRLPSIVLPAASEPLTRIPLLVFPETLKKLSQKLHVTVDHLLGTDEVHMTIAEESKLVAARDPRQLEYIVDRARDNPALTRVLLTLLRLCEERFGEEAAAEDLARADEPADDQD